MLAAAVAHVTNVVMYVLGRRRQEARDNPTCGGGGDGGADRPSLLSRIVMAIERDLQNVADTVMSVFRRSEGNESNSDINTGSLPKDAEGRASRWLKFSRRFNVSDLEREHMPPGDGDSEAMVARDLPRMGITNPDNKSQIGELLVNFAKEYPILGYKQVMQPVSLFSCSVTSFRYCTVQ